jgi:polyisoprenoid-binding protein YceI
MSLKSIVFVAAAFLSMPTISVAQTTPATTSKPSTKITNTSKTATTAPAALPATSVKKITAEKTASTITYTMVHPMHTWDGVSKEVTCNIAFDEKTNIITQVGVSAPIASFDTKNASRDSHAMEVLEGIKYPKVTFLSTKIEVVGNILTVSGNLTFHGVTKPITFKATRTDSDKTMTVAGDFIVKLTAHNIEKPSLMTIAVKDDMAMKFSVVFKK